jgi:hypothetical protein
MVGSSNRSPGDRRDRSRAPDPGRPRAWPALFLVGGDGATRGVRRSLDVGPEGRGVGAEAGSPVSDLLGRARRWHASLPDSWEPDPSDLDHLSEVAELLREVVSRALPPHAPEHPGQFRRRARRPSKRGTLRELPGPSTPPP